MNPIGTPGDRPRCQERLVIGGVVRDGVVVPHRPLAEGTRVQIDVPRTPEPTATQKRQGGWWRERVRISPDFELPEDIRRAFGMDDE